MRRLLGGDPADAARTLVGARLVRDGPDGRPRIGRIVEVEAYGGPEDRASHARSGRTRRNAAMYGPPGRAYVYRVYGMYTCLNVVSGPAGSPAAALIRAVEPVDGIPAMRIARLDHDLQRRRATRGDRAEAGTVATVRSRIDNLRPAALAAGPGLVGEAFSIDLADDGTDLCDPDSPLRLEEPPAGEEPPSIRSTGRIGVAYAGEPWSTLRWRFVALPASAPSDTDT